MLGGFFCNMFVFFCQDANWHNPAEKIFSCIRTIFHCTLPNNLPAQCAAIKVKHYVHSPWISRWVPDNNRNVQLSMAALILAWMQQGNLASRCWGS